MVKTSTKILLGLLAVILVIGLALNISFMFATDPTNQPPVEASDRAGEVEVVNTYAHPDGNIYDCIHYTNGDMHCSLGSDPDIGGGRILP